MLHKPRNARNHQNLEKAKKVPSQEPSGGSWPCQGLDFVLLASRTMRITFCYFKTASWWQFLKAALGNERGCSLMHMFVSPRLSAELWNLEPGDLSLIMQKDEVFLAWVWESLAKLQRARQGFGASRPGLESSSVVYCVT